MSSSSFLEQIPAFVTTVTDGLFTNVEIPSGDLTSSSWNKFVYRVYEGSGVTQEACTAMCAFDYDSIDRTYDYGCYDHYRHIQIINYINRIFCQVRHYPLLPSIHLCTSLARE